MFPHARATNWIVRFSDLRTSRAEILVRGSNRIETLRLLSAWFLAPRFERLKVFESQRLHMHNNQVT
jgi:hypothetical protein